MASRLVLVFTLTHTTTTTITILIIIIIVTIVPVSSTEQVVAPLCYQCYYEKYLDLNSGDSSCQHPTESSTKTEICPSNSCAVSTWRILNRFLFLLGFCEYMNVLLTIKICITISKYNQVFSQSHPMFHVQFHLSITHTHTHINTWFTQIIYVEFNFIT